MRSIPFVLAGLLVWLATAISALGRDSGQWEMVSPDIRAYFASLMQPDNPSTSCCGESDSYWADEVDECLPEEGPNCVLVAVITDTRADAPLNRKHFAPGTRIAVPQNKIRKHPIPNPTEHNLLFLGTSGFVYCWEPLPGI